MPLLAIVIVYGAGISKNGVSKRSSKFCVFYGLLDYIGFILSQMVDTFQTLARKFNKANLYSVHSYIFRLPTFIDSEENSLQNPGETCNNQYNILQYNLYCAAR